MDLAASGRSWSMPVRLRGGASTGQPRAMTTAPASTGTPGPLGGDTAPDDDTTSEGRTVPPSPYELGDAPGPLDADALRRLDAWWRAAN